MKLDYDSFPLDIYNQAESKSLLRSIEKDLKKTTSSDSSVGMNYFASLIIKLAGGQLLELIDEFTLGYKVDKAHKCFSNLIREQVNRIKDNPNRLQEEAQLFLMTSLCVSRILSSKESGSFAHVPLILVKSIYTGVTNVSFKKGFKELAKNIDEISNKYDEFCQVYYIAFLLWVYNSDFNDKDLIKSLIKETMCDDEDGNNSLVEKKHPVLFSNNKLKSIEENVHERIDYLSEESKKDKDLYNTFIKPFIKDNQWWLNTPLE